ncbi:MAG TPA: GNAT family N-acetyltransferase [Herpetosiphonaceae bacterium]
MEPSPLFTTDRLAVREFTAADLDDFARLCADPVAMRWMGDGQPLSRASVEQWIGVCRERYASRGYGTSAVFERESGGFAGFCGVVRAAGNDFDEIIYAFEQRCWGRGYAAEAGRAMLEYVFARSGLDRIYATIHPDNRASIAVAGKLGMRFERQEIEDDGVPVGFYVIERPAPAKR